MATTPHAASTAVHRRRCTLLPRAMPQDNTPADAATAKHNKGKNPNVAALVREWKVAIANHKANPQLVDYGRVGK